MSRKSDAYKASQEAKIAARVEKLMSDTSYDWLRSRAALRTAAAITMLLSLATPVGFWFSQILGLICAGLMFIGYLLLRTATREVAELPAKYLDERQLSIRNSIYVRSYQTLGAIYAAVALIAFGFGIYLDSSNLTTLSGIGFDQMQAAVWVFFGPLTVVPTVVYAFLSDENPPLARMNS